jgi:hypothetical protein
MERLPRGHEHSANTARVLSPSAQPRLLARLNSTQRKQVPWPYSAVRASAPTKTSGRRRPKTVKQVGILYLRYWRRWLAVLLTVGVVSVSHVGVAHAGLRYVWRFRCVIWVRTGGSILRRWWRRQLATDVGRWPPDSDTADHSSDGGAKSAPIVMPTGQTPAAASESDSHSTDHSDLPVPIVRAGSSPASKGQNGDSTAPTPIVPPHS